MFKALAHRTEKEIIILDPFWSEDTIEPLRKQGQDDDLLCPVCRQPVLVRAGNKKRWHFAHKDLSNCPLKHESPNILQARTLLYSWLKSKLGERVTIEKHFPKTNLPRPIDCYVELSEEQKIGYWILERGIRDRWKLQRTLSSLGISIIWVPLINMLKPDDKDLEAVYLTPTERDIAFSSDFNQLYSTVDSAVSYVDIDKKTVITLRGLACIHLPQKYAFDAKLETNLNEMLFFPQTGEFVHPGEYEQLVALKEKSKEQERLRKIENLRHMNFSNTKEHATYKEDFIPKRPPSSTFQKKEKKESYNYIEQPYPCEICGTETANWSTLDLKSNTCICSSECLAKSQENKGG